MSTLRHSSPLLGAVSIRRSRLRSARSRFQPRPPSGCEACATHQDSLGRGAFSGAAPFWTPEARRVLNPRASNSICSYRPSAGRPVDRIVMRFPAPERAGCDCLKIVVSPVRFRASPLHLACPLPSRAFAEARGRIPWARRKRLAEAHSTAGTCGSGFSRVRRFWGPLWVRLVQVRRAPLRLIRRRPLRQGLAPPGVGLAPAAAAYPALFARARPARVGSAPRLPPPPAPGLPSRPAWRSSGLLVPGFSELFTIPPSDE